MSAEAYPLAWPDGWPRTPHNKRAWSGRFRGGETYETDSSGGRRYVGRKMITFDRARRLLAEELERMKATNVVLSTNVPLRLDGQPRAGEVRAGTDPGVAVYFTFKGRQMVMAQDGFDTIAGNLRSLGLAIEALRQLERHGGGQMMERAFAGFLAIAPPDWKKPWREVFSVTPDWKGDVRALYREKARERHPDVGGHDTLMAELNLAYREALEETGQ